MDTYAIFEGAMRLLAARQGAIGADQSRFYPPIADASDSDIQNAVDLAVRTWCAAFDATKPVSREVTR